MKAQATEEQVRAVCQKIEKLGYRSHSMPGATRTAIGITGNKGALDPALFRALEGVADADDRGLRASFEIRYQEEKDATEGRERLRHARLRAGWKRGAGRREGALPVWAHRRVELGGGADA